MKILDWKKKIINNYPLGLSSNALIHDPISNQTDHELLEYAENKIDMDCMRGNVFPTIPIKNQGNK